MDGHDLFVPFAVRDMHFRRVFSDIRIRCAKVKDELEGCDHHSRDFCNWFRLNYRRFTKVFFCTLNGIPNAIVYGGTGQKMHYLAK